MRADNERLRAIVEGRTVAPTIREARAHCHGASESRGAFVVTRLDWGAHGGARVATGYNHPGAPSLDRYRRHRPPMPVAGDAVTALLALVVASWVCSRAAQPAPCAAPTPPASPPSGTPRRSLTVADVRLATTTCAPGVAEGVP